MSTAKELREQIASLVRRYHQAQFSDRTFNPETDLVHYAGRVFDDDELCNLVDASLDFFLTANRYADEFEAEFADYLGMADALLVNSGSSANLVALTTLTSPKLGDRRLRPWRRSHHRRGGISDDRCADPAEQPRAGVRRRQSRRLHRERRAAARGHRTADARHHDGAHARRSLRPRCRRRSWPSKHDLWVVEDNCDALGSRYRDRLTGTFGHLATVSFYPAHHITMGEGGCGRHQRRSARAHRAVVPRLGPRLLLRRRREQHLRHPLQSAVRQPAARLRPQVRLQPHRLQPESHGHAGGDRLRAAAQARRLRRQPPRQLRPVDGAAARPMRIDCSCRGATAHAEPSWFGFVITVREDAGFTRDELVRFLEVNRIETRSLFAGNLLRHPAFEDIPHRDRSGFVDTDLVMRNTFFMGVYPGLDAASSTTWDPSSIGS